MAPILNRKQEKSFWNPEPEASTVATNPEPDPQRAKELAEAHERMVGVARKLVKRLGAHDAAGVLLGAIHTVFLDALGRDRARELLREVAERLLTHDGLPPGAQRN
jgi:hypothetical protein